MTDILVVDDDLGLREILELTLGELGFTVATVSDGAEALQWLRDHEHEPPRLVLLDWMMPRCNATEFRHAQLRDARIAKIPVVLLTADLRIDAKRAELDVDDYLQKPVRLATLREVTSHYVNGGRAS